MSEQKQETAGCQGCACMGAGPMLSQLAQKLGPDESVKQHFRNARLEFLKGIREMLDKRIADLAGGQQTRGAKVSID